jgi:DNA-binding FadR family transcriptional regulator
VARLHRDMLRVLIEEIVSGQSAPGSTIMKEVDLATEFGVSRGVVRECVRALEERDLISVKHGRGATVRNSDEWNVLDSDVLGALLTVGQDQSVMAEFLECRFSLEVEAAGLAARRATRQDLRALSDAFRLMQETAEKVADVANRSAQSAVSTAEETFLKADIGFHQAVIDAAHNRALAHMLRPLDQALLLIRVPLSRPHAREERGLPEHQRILTAILSQDEDGARQAMAEHLTTVGTYLDELSHAVPLSI